MGKPATSARLKLDTKREHQEAESTPFMRALLRGEASQHDYRTYLRCLSIIHGALETVAGQSRDAALRAVWREDMRKLPLLTQDVADLAGEDSPGGDAAIQWTLSIVARIHRDWMDHPKRLLGALYVLEGSTNGGQAFLHRVVEAFALDEPAGVRYLASYGEDQPEAWATFKERLDSAVTEPTEYEEVCAGAKALFADLRSLLLQLDGTAREVNYMGHSFNAEAGNHPAPQRDGELRAVLEAAARASAAVPYIEARYGERGMRFTTSDGAWLATLAGYTPRSVYRQVDWLAKVLSVRGVPRAVLELHLRETEKALNAEFPDEAEKHAVLSLAAEHLSAQGEAALDADTRRRLTESVTVAGLHLPDFFVEVWLSITADELMDQRGALGEFLQWLEDGPWNSALASACRHALREHGPGPLRALAVGST